MQTDFQMFEWISVRLRKGYMRCGLNDIFPYFMRRTILKLRLTTPMSAESVV